MTATVTINGITISGRNSVVVANGRVVVDGKDVTPDAKAISIEVHGNIEELRVDACESVHVAGNVGSVGTVSGDVRCGDVGGNVATVSGDVECRKIAGSASSLSGDISTR